MQNKTIVILGSTCTGKTSLAVSLCQRFNGSIISADSRQVVRYMNVGTGKVPVDDSSWHVEEKGNRWVINGVDVFGYDLVDPDEYFSAYDFVQYCRGIFPRVSHKGRNVFLVGGTGFYIDAVLGRVSLDNVGPNMELRKSLERLSTEKLAKKLLELDESAYGEVDVKNPVRLIRAIERTMMGRMPQAFTEVGGEIRDLPQEVRGIRPIQLIGLTAAREVLYDRADRWVDSIFGEKLFKEVKQIQSQFPKSHRLKGLVYKSAVDYLNGVAALEKARQRAKFDIHAYIRRQQTWFKRSSEIKWFDVSQKNFDAEVISLVESELDG